MLLSQDSGGHKDGDLSTGLDGFEGGTNGQLGLTVADVAAEQPVHGLRSAHVGFELVQSGELIGGFLIDE